MSAPGRAEGNARNAPRDGASTGRPGGCESDARQSARDDGPGEPPRHLTLDARLALTAAARPAHPALVFDGTVFDYAALDARVDALASVLRQDAGLRPGERVLLMSPNHADFVIAVYAAWRAGAVVVPVNPMSTAEDIAYFAADSGAVLALAAADRLAQVAEAVPGLACLALGDATARAARAPATRLDDSATVQRSADALCLLPYTSGTTGRPKGCRHTHATLSASLAASAAWRGYGPEAVFLGAGPLFHMQGLQNGMNLPLWLGATSVIMARWDADTAASLIEAHGVTAWSAAPTMLVDFFASETALRRELRSLRLVSGGGAALPQPVAEALKQRLGLTYNEAYGMTETASFLLANPVGAGKPGCLGRAPPGVEALVVDPQTGEPVADGEPGELVVRAPQVMDGYWTCGLQPAADEGAWLRHAGRRFLRTGDLVLRDADGDHFLRDRLKRMINCAGFKVWPAEVEAVLHRHPAVQEACVIAMHDERRGEAVKAVVVRRPGMALDEAALIRWAREAMAVYKAPRAVEFTDRLPRTATGKTAWRALQEAQARADNERPPRQPPGDTS